MKQKRLSTQLRNKDSVLNPEREGWAFTSFIPHFSSLRAALIWSTANARKSKSLSEFYPYPRTQGPFIGPHRIEENCLCIRTIKLFSFLSQGWNRSHTYLNKATERTWTGSLLYLGSRRFSPWCLGHRLLIKLKENIGNILLIFSHQLIAFCDNHTNS